MFLMPGLIIACYVTGVFDTVLSPQHRQEMIRYLTNHQNEDGGYGLHIEGGSTMFGTGLRQATRDGWPSEKARAADAAARKCTACAAVATPALRQTSGKQQADRLLTDRQCTARVEAFLC
jgi:Prenyltransferase and squalene oxidase repeat